MQEIKECLNNEDPEVRRRAVEDLRGRSPEEAISLLVKAFEDKSWRVRKTAAEILVAEHPMDRYIRELFRLLYQENNAGARNTAIETLVRLGKRSTPYLIEAFETHDRDVRKFIIDIIGEIRDRDALPLLLKSLKDEDDNVRASAVEHLGHLAEPEVVDDLVAILRSGDTWTAFPAADALGRIGDRRAVPALLEALEVKALREPVLKSLGRLSVIETLEHVIPFLSVRSKGVQEEAVKAVEMFYHNGVSAEVISGSLRRICGTEVVDILISHAWSRKGDVRAAAILLLGLMQDERALFSLLELSSEEDLVEDVKRAFIFIGRNKPEYLIPLFKTENEHMRRFTREVASLIASPLYYSVFERDLSDTDGHVRSFAAAGLANLGELRAVEPLKRLLTDPYEDVQESAVMALSRLAGGLKIEEFIDYLRDTNTSMRKNAALILGRTGAKDAVQALGFALKDVDISVRSAVVKALASIKGPKSVKFLMFALTDENPDIRTTAALSLGSLGGEGVLEALGLLFSDTHDKVRAAAARAFGMLGERRALKNLVNLLFDRNGFVVTSAMESLGRIGGEEARTALIGMLGSDDAEIRRTAIASLSSFEGIEGVVIPYLRDGDWATRIAAVETLGKRMTDRMRAEFESLLDVENDPAVRRVIGEHLRGR